MQTGRRLEICPTGRRWSGFGLDDGFVWEIAAEGFEAVKIFHGAAVQALGLGLIAKEEREAGGLAGLEVETFAEGVGAVLGFGDFDIAGEIAGQGQGERVIAVEHLIEAGSEDAGFERGGAKEGLLGEGDAFDGEEFLGIDGLVEVDQIVLQPGDGILLFEADDGEVGGGEAVFARVLGGAHLTLGRARAGGAGGVGAVGGQTPGGNSRHGILSHQQ